MTITTKQNANGRISVKVNGKITAVSKVESLVRQCLRDKEQVELIAADGHKFTCTGYGIYEFAHTLCRKSSFNFMDCNGETFSADDMVDAIYSADKYAAGEFVTNNIFVRYAVSTDAQDVAAEAEIQLAEEEKADERAREIFREEMAERRAWEDAQPYYDERDDFTSYTEQDFQDAATEAEMELATAGTIEQEIDRLAAENNALFKYLYHSDDAKRSDELFNRQLKLISTGEAHSSEYNQCCAEYLPLHVKLVAAENQFNKNDDTITRLWTILKENRAACECAVTVDAQEVAIDAEIQLANSEEENTMTTATNFEITETINGEQVTFKNSSIVKIIAPKLGFGYSTETGKGKFYSLRNGVLYRPAAKKHIFNRYAELELAADQLADAKKFFDACDGNNEGDFFKVCINLRLADGKAHLFRRYFNFFNQARDFADAVSEKFADNVEYFLAIDRNHINESHRYYQRDREGNITCDIPNTDFCAALTTAEIQTQIDEINLAIADNEKFAELADHYVWSALMTANHDLRKTRNLLKFALHECENAPQPAEPEGYTFTVTYDDGTETETKCKIFGDTDHFNNSVYRELIFFDAHDKREWRITTAGGKLVAKGFSEGDVYKFLAADTDGSEEDDGESAFKLLPTLDELNDVDEFTVPQIIETVEIDEDGNERCRFVVNGETVTCFNGELDFIWSEKYRAGFSGRRNCYLVEVPDGQRKKFISLDADEFFNAMIERGACSFGEHDAAQREQCGIINQDAPAGRQVNPVGDKFTVQFGGQTVTTLDKSPVDKAYNAFQRRYAAINAAAPAGWRVVTVNFGVNEKSFDKVGVSNGGTLHTSFDTADLPERFFGEPETFWSKFDTWRSAAHMISFVDWLHKGDSFIQITEQCAQLNNAAPRNWCIRHGEKGFAVLYVGQTVTTLDSLALANILSPEQFFEQFKPLVDKNFDSDKQFIADRQAEIAALREMREQIHDPDRIKIIDKLITQNELAL